MRLSGGDRLRLRHGRRRRWRELFEMGIDQIEYAAEVALEHHLGLTCDPICGLVQIPCIERNAVAAMRAINAVRIANFLTATRKISFDTVVQDHVRDRARPFRPLPRDRRGRAGQALPPFLRKMCPRGARFYKYLLREGAKLCYNLSENALAPIRAALSPTGMPSGDEAQGGKNKEGTPQWQSFP